MKKELWFTRRGLRLSVICLMVFFLIFGQTFVFAAEGAAAQAAAEKPIKLLSEKKIGEGTTLKTYEKWIGGSLSKVYVTEIDLHNEYVKISPIFGKGGKIAKQPLSSMANENGAVMAINANFFHLTQRPAPFAMELKDRELITSQSYLLDWMVFGVTGDKTALIGSFGFKGEVVAPDGASFPIFNLNKEFHNTHAGPSHLNRLNLYNHRWSGPSIGTIPGATGVVEVVVQDGIVTDIRVDQPGVPIPENGYVLTGHGEAAKFLLQHVRKGDSLQIHYTYTPETIDLEQAIGAHALLVDQGKPVPISPRVYMSGERARSGVGISQDGKTVYLVAVEASKESRGVTMENFARILAELGIWRAANLDGGGSTTVVARLPGDRTVTLINKPEGGSERHVPDGIAVFNTAPPGRLAGIILGGPVQVLVGSRTTFSLKGYDEHILPYDVSPQTVSWASSDSSVGVFENGQFVAKTGGVTRVTAQAEGVVSNEHTVTVYGGKDIASVEVIPAEINILPGDRLTLQVNVKTKNGLTFKAAPDSIAWTVEGVDGQAQGLSYQAGGQPGSGVLKGNIDGFTFTVPVRQGSVAEPFTSFEGISGFQFTHYPGTMPGKFERVSAQSGEPVFRGQHAMKLTYQFKQNTEVDLQNPDQNVEIAYGRFNGTSLTLPGKPIGLGVWVYGDNSNYWLRAEVKDKNGKVHFVTLADRIDWSGWKYVEGRIPAGAAYPVTLTSLYVVDRPSGEMMNRPLTGTVYFDQVTVLQPVNPARVYTAKTVKPNPKDYRTDLTYSFPDYQLKLLGGELAKHAAEYTVTPVEMAKYEKPVVGYQPLSYGFRLDAVPKSGASPFAIFLKGASNQGLGLLKWNEQGNRWDEISGFPTANQEWRFELREGGFYLPVIKAQAVPFQDIAAHWARDEIARMYAAGIASGVSEREFRPNDPLTRAQFVAFLYRALEKRQPDLLKQVQQGAAVQFKDPVPAWAQKGVTAAVRLGVIQGFPDRTFRAQLNLNREQFASILARTVKNLHLSPPLPGEKPAAADAAQIPAWAREGAEMILALKLLPVQNNRFDPKKPVTRGEAVYAIAKLYDWLGK